MNNVYVSARNHGFDPHAYLAGIPADRVGQLHLAGHSDKGRYLLDSHDHEVPAAVWDLYRETLRRVGPVSTLVEWDDHIPPLERLAEESRRAGAIAALGPEAFPQTRLELSPPSGSSSSTTTRPRCGGVSRMANRPAPRSSMRRP